MKLMQLTRPQLWVPVSVPERPVSDTGDSGTIRLLMMCSLMSSDVG